MERSECNINKTQVIRQFHRHVSTYDAHAMVQLQMAHELAALAAENAPHASALLELGCGTGRLTERLLHHWPDARLTAIDIAPAMAQATANRNAAYAARLNVLVGDAERLPDVLGCAPQPMVDLVASGATFQWFIDPASTVDTLTRYVHPGGIVAFSTFGPDTFRELRAAFVEAETELGLPHTPRTLHFPDLSDWVRWFASAGAALRVKEWRVTVTHATPLDFLKSIKKVGANIVRPSNAREHFAKQLFNAMSAAYIKQTGTPEGVPVTYHIYYGVATVNKR
jgi:malonyl-CoA O-methyltransferase